MEPSPNDPRDTSDSLRFQCPDCSKAYKRQEHLQRHQATHSTDRPHTCHLCKASFQRSDVLKRHEKTCLGKRRKSSTCSPSRACDECTRAQRVCSMRQPCLSCLTNGLACSYNALRDPAFADPRVAEQLPKTTSLQANPPQDLPAMPFLESLDGFTSNLLDDTSWTGLGAIPQDPFRLWSNLGIEPPAITLHFLEGFTRNKGLIASFDCGTEAQRTLARSTFVSQVTAQESISPAYDPLRMTCHEIVSLVEEVIKIKPRNSAVTMTWSPVVGSMCAEFFSPFHIRLYLELYWALWHPNVNILHRPTFDPAAVKPILVATMVIIGASVSPDTSDREYAKMWFNAVEEAAFQDDSFCSGAQDSRPTSLKQQLQSLQAAYIVCLFQNWNGTDSSKCRIRRFRYGNMIAVARDIGITFARHPAYHVDAQCDFVWADFVLREELIRVFLWIFLLDTAFVIFNNLPPRLAVMEMTQHFACSEACFQATTRELCWAQLVYEVENTNYTVSSLCERMCSGPMDTVTLASLADLGPLNLFVITSAFHSLIFQAQQSFGYNNNMTPIRHGLDNWITIWNIYSTTLSQSARHEPLSGAQLTPENIWRRTGFLRNAPEYWMLAKLIVEKISAKGKLYGSPTDQYPFQNRVPGQEGPSEPLLGKYDDTSMKQVNDLIAEFQNIIL